MTREGSLRQRLTEGKPDVVVDLYLYAEVDGGKTHPIGMGWGCSCSTDKTLTEGWDGYPPLDDEMLPGEHRKVGMVFLSGQTAVDALASSGHFFVGRPIYRRGSDRPLRQVVARKRPERIPPFPPS